MTKGSTAQTKKPSKAGANDPDLILKYCDLAQKLGQTERARPIMRQLRGRLGSWSAPQLMRLIKVSEQSGDYALAAIAFEEVGARDTITLPLAMFTMRLAHTSHDRERIPEVRSWLEARLAKDNIGRFCLQSDHLLFGPDVAMANARRGGTKQRTPNEAADLAKIVLDAGRRKLALRYLAMCRRRWPHSFQFVDMLAAALLKFGHPEKALNLLSEAAYPGDTRVLGLRLTILLQSAQLKEAEQLIEDAGDIGKTLLSPLQMMKLKLGRGAIDEADALGRIVASGIGRGGNAQSKFRTTHIGSLLNEAQIFMRTTNGGSEVTANVARAYFYPAKLALDDWQDRVPAETSGAGESDIPRSIFQYWNTKIIPEEIDMVMESWRTVPGYSYRRFDRDAARDFLKDRFDDDHLRAFRLANNVAEECDFLRICVMLVEGGIYADADDMRVGDLDVLRALGRGAILFREPIIGSVSNNVMLARPGHPIFQIAVDMTRQSLIGRENDNTWAKTGPGMVARATAAYIAETPAEQVAQNLCLLPDYILSRQVQIHMPLPYKSTPAYWNSKDGANPPELDRVLRKLTGAVPAATPADGA